MGMSYQTKLAKAFYNYQNKAQGFQVKISGTEVKTMLIEMVEDKYQNTHYVVKNALSITAIFDFPNDEVPINLTSSQNTDSSSSSNTLHLYDILPITMFVKNEQIKDLNITKGTLVLYPIKLLDGNVSLTTFQITDCVAKGNPNYGILWEQFTVAPITDYALVNNSEYQRILNEFAQELNDF